MNLRKIALACAGALFVCAVIICGAIGIVRGYALDIKDGQCWICDTQGNEMTILVGEKFTDDHFKAKISLNNKEMREGKFYKEGARYTVAIGDEKLFEGTFYGIYNTRFYIGNKSFLVMGADNGSLKDNDGVVNNG